MPFAHYTSSYRQAAAPPGSWDVFGVVFSNTSLTVSNDDILFLDTDTTQWSAAQDFTNAAGNTARLGWVGPTPINGGTLGTDPRWGGFVNMNLATEGVFRLGIAAADVGSDYDCVISCCSLHSGSYNCKAGAYTDGTTTVAEFNELSLSNLQRFHLNGTQYTEPNWLAADVPSGAGRFRATNVQEFVEFRVDANVNNGVGSNSYARFASIRVYKV